MFINELVYERVPGKVSPFGRPVYVLKRPFCWSNGKESVVCIKGFEKDFASIPKFVFFLSSKNGKWKKASVIHDKACILASTGKWKYITADNIYFEALLDDGASKFTAWLFYLAVRLNHFKDVKGTSKINKTTRK